AGAYEVARVQRRQELDPLVAREQALVAVGVDGQLSDDVAEDLEPVGAVDQVATVVGVRGRQPHTQFNAESLHAAHDTAPEDEGESRCRGNCGCSRPSRLLSGGRSATRQL